MKHIGVLLQNNMDDIIKHDRRYKQFSFNICLAKSWFIKILEALPDDAFIVSTGYDIESATNRILIWSSRFPKVEQAQVIPHVIVEINSQAGTVALMEYERSTQKRVPMTLLDDGDIQKEAVAENRDPNARRILLGDGYAVQT